MSLFLILLLFCLEVYSESPKEEPVSKIQEQWTTDFLGIGMSNNIYLDSDYTRYLDLPSKASISPSYHHRSYPLSPQ